MALTLYLRKLYGTFAPADSMSADAMDAMKPNGEYKAVFSQPRNLPFHKKAFTLVKVAFDAWEPEQREYRGQVVEKNFDNFRDELTILSGFYSATYNYKGDLKLVARSWSFAKMSQDEFDAMYSKLIDVILTKILTGYKKEDLDMQVNKILGFC